MMSGNEPDAAASEGPANLTVTVRDGVDATKSQKMSIAFLAPTDDTVDDPRCGRGSAPPPALLDPVRSSRGSAPCRVAEYGNAESGPGPGAGPVDRQTLTPGHAEGSSESFIAWGKTALLPSRTATTGISVLPLHPPPTVIPGSVQRSGAALFIDASTSSRDFIESEESRRENSLSDSESIATGPLTTFRTTRPPRPAYTEEQKFFIMYMRIILNKPWSAIEDAYTEMFGPDRTGGRSKGGLTSVYYRIRRNWGLEEVLQTSPNAIDGDRRMIEFRARNFSEDFLSSIGYPLGE
ncbi:hypothetical protein Tdes44962_MAKER10231 [Teratosphaeria destructans]|uniref:Uncharacterized protein n=1 Tax=Teratosphaeria destructans TaxID=418781 RepID=A0A9W7SMN7_9PEZI|nr:hypothetical protein Tdes44962_MAKER10231 [Teratosphaeria destructans]